MLFRTPAKRFAMLVAAVGALSAATPTGAQPATVDLVGIIHDFRWTHPDFNLGLALGHYADNVGLALDAGGLPVYTGPGYRVSTEWKDSSVRNIAPHIFGVSAGSCLGRPLGATTKTDFYVNNQCEVWGYIWNTTPPGAVPAVITTNATGTNDCEVLNSSAVHGDVLVGAGANPADVVRVSPNSDIFGTLGNLSAPIPMPVVSAPTNLGPSTGNLTFNSGLGNQIATDRHVNTLTITGSARVTIPAGAHVTILAEAGVWIDANGSPQAGLYIADDASLDLYVRGEMNISSRAEAVNLDPSVFRVYMLDAELNLFSNAPGRLRAQVFAPNDNLEMTQSAEFWGTFWGNQLDMENGCKTYLDMSLRSGPADAAGVAGAAGGGIQSAATFAQWFANVMNVNLSKSHTITLNRDGSGVYEYLDDAFHPINGYLFGNEGELHNNNFTYAIDATFTYSECGGQFVEFRGADDMWLFIDGALVMDLGGTQAMVTQYLEIDRLGLTDGSTYPLKLFYAQRNPTQAKFRLRTNLVLSSTAAAVNISTPFD